MGAPDVRHFAWRMGFPLPWLRLQPSRADMAWTPSLEMPAGGSSKGSGAACSTAAWTATIFMRSKPCSAWWSAGTAGESGVKWVQSYRGEDFWKAHQRRPTSGRSDLVEAALCRSHTLRPAREGFNDIFPTADDMRRLVKDPAAYHYEHLDGVRCTVLMMSGRWVEDFNFATPRLEGRAQPFSTQMYLPMPSRANQPG